MLYRLYFFDTEGHIRSRRELDAADDQSASAEAQILFANFPQFPACELWQDARLVRRFER